MNATPFLNHSLLAPTAIALSLVVGTACQSKGSGTSNNPSQTSSKGSETETATGTVEKVDSTRAHQMAAKGALLLDVRTPEEFAGGHIDAAVNIPVGELGSRLGEVSQEQRVVVYCQSGRRAARAADLLSSQGYQVYNLGPISAW